MAEVVILADQREVASLVAEHLAGLIEERPDLVLGVATGSSPLRVYDALGRLVRERGIDTSGVTAFSLDEYVGLPLGHPASYREVVRTEVTEKLGLDPARVHTPDGAADDPFAAARAYDDAIAAAGGVDVQILGIGHNGHLAFNEPGSSLASRTRVKALTARTRAANARFFADPDDVPQHCITQGVGTILEARHLILLAFGDEKADAVARAVEGPVSARVPASALQLHPRVSVLLDEPAASGLELADDYRHAWELKFSSGRLFAAHESVDPARFAASDRL